MKRTFSIIGIIILSISMIFVTTGCESKRPEIKITLEDGRVMNFTLYRNYAPDTVAHFLSLCESGYYNNTIVSDMQTSRILMGNYSYDKDLYLKAKSNVDTIDGEFTANGTVVQNNPLLHTLGVLSMYNEWGDGIENGSKNSASNIFFIATSTVTSYDGRYATFGKISDDDSLAVLEEIMADETTYADNYQYSELNEEYGITLPSVTIVIKTIEIIKQ